MIWSRETIEQLKEDELRRKILMPLFERMGYRGIQDHHGGALEQGKDLVMWKVEEIRGRVNYAVVVKAQRISGSTKTGEVLTQIQECLGSEFIDKKTHTKEKVHHVLVVSSVLSS